MSGIFGIYNRNGKAVEKIVINDMLDTLSYWNPDEKGVWIDGPVGLGHTMLWNTPESKYEHLPLKKDTYVLTMDARIDNRDDLVEQLVLPNRPLSEVGDSDFILAAYKKWGNACPKYLLGDFSFVIWDEREQRFFCVRDHIGIKSFYYYIDDEYFVFSNDIKGVLSHSAVSDALDNDIIAMHIHGEGIETERKTFFKDIKKLPASSSLVVTKKDIHETTYWKIEDVPCIKLESPEAYSKKLRELLDSAVEMRLRTQYPVISHLSGGIDSSSIAVLASRILKERGEKLHVYNWIDIPENPDEYEYESWNFSRRIADTEDNIEHHEFSIDPEYIVYQYDHHNILTKGSTYFWEEYYIQNKAYDSGVRTILSGWGGDELISNHGAGYIDDLFKKGKIFQGFKYLFEEKKQKKYSWNICIKHLLKIIIPSSIISFIHNDNARVLDNAKVLDDAKYCFFATNMLSQILDKSKVKIFSDDFSVRERQKMYYNNGHLLERVESWQLAAFSKRLEYAYPLLDKRIVEFALGVPENLFYPKEGKRRHLIKNAVADLLPLDILWSTKVEEPKIDKIKIKKFYETLKILQRNMKNIDCEKYNQNYIDCKKMKEALLCDLKSDKHEQYPKVVLAYMLMKSIYDI